jgi:hypothetical protein
MFVDAIYTGPTGKKSGHPRGLALDTHMAALQAEQKRETQFGILKV